MISTMKTTLNLDDDVYEAARARAQATGKPLGRVLSEMARQALQSSGPRSKRAARGTSRFPVFEVPADAQMIPASRVQKAVDEDGIV